MSANTRRGFIATIALAVGEGTSAAFSKGSPVQKRKRIWVVDLRSTPEEEREFNGTALSGRECFNAKPSPDKCYV